MGDFPGDNKIFQLFVESGVACYFFAKGDSDVTVIISIALHVLLNFEFTCCQESIASMNQINYAYLFCFWQKCKQFYVFALFWTMIANCYH